MSEPQGVFTLEEIRAQAQTNASAGILMVLVLARHHGQPLTDAARFMGQVFAPSWDETQGQGAREVARWVALNAVTCGAELSRLDGNEQQAEVAVAGWPSEEDLALFDLSRDEADLIHELYHPIAERLGLSYAWRRDGDVLVMTFAAVSA